MIKALKKKYALSDQGAKDLLEFYLMRPETLSTWAKNHIKSTTNSCFE